MNFYKKNEIELNIFKNKVWRGLFISNSAFKQISKLIINNFNNLGLRINIKKSGCAGFVCFLEKNTHIEKDDLIYEYKNIKLYTNKKIMYLIDGTKLDYVKKGLNFIFKFNVPKAQHACGCGESFSF